MMKLNRRNFLKLFGKTIVGVAGVASAVDSVAVLRPEQEPAVLQQKEPIDKFKKYCNMKEGYAVDTGRVVNSRGSYHYPVGTCTEMK